MQSIYEHFSLSEKKNLIFWIVGLKANISEGAGVHTLKITLYGRL